MSHRPISFETALCLAGSKLLGPLGLRRNCIVVGVCYQSSVPAGTFAAGRGLRNKSSFTPVKHVLCFMERKVPAVWSTCSDVTACGVEAEQETHSLLQQVEPVPGTASYRQAVPLAPGLVQRSSGCSDYLGSYLLVA